MRPLSILAILLLPLPISCITCHNGNCGGPGTSAALSEYFANGSSFLRIDFAVPRDIIEEAWEPVEVDCGHRCDWVLECGCFKYFEKNKTCILAKSYTVPIEELKDVAGEDREEAAIVADGVFEKIKLPVNIGARYSETDDFCIPDADIEALKEPYTPPFSSTSSSTDTAPDVPTERTTDTEIFSSSTAGASSSSLPTSIETTTLTSEPTHHSSLEVEAAGSTGSTTGTPDTFDSTTQSETTSSIPADMSSTSTTIETTATTATTTSATPMVQPTRPKWTSGATLSPTVICDSDKCTCARGKELRVSFGATFYTSYSLVPFNNKWQVRGELDDNRLTLMGPYAPNADCVDSIREVFAPECPLPIVISGSYTSNGGCKGGQVTATSTSRNEMCDSDNVQDSAVCKNGKYYCGDQEFKVGRIFC